MALPAVSVPVGDPQAVINLFSSLRTRVGRNMSQAAASVAIAISVCETDSDSQLRFAAYSSLAFAFVGQGSGADAVLTGALWWEGLSECGAVGSEMFSLVAGINHRLTQQGWTDVFAQQLANSTSRCVRHLPFCCPSAAFPACDFLPSLAVCLARGSTASSLTIPGSLRPGDVAGAKGTAFLLCFQITKEQNYNLFFRSNGSRFDCRRNRPHHCRPPRLDRVHLRHIHPAVCSARRRPSPDCPADA